MAMVEVNFKWSDEYGECYKCGLPAAFYLTHQYGDRPHNVKDEDKRCAVCAANNAAFGDEIGRLDCADDNGED